MVNSLVAWSIRARSLILAVAAVVIILGVQQVRQAETEVLPEFSPAYVEVQTEALGLSAEEVEQLITAPMENLLLNGVAYLDGIRSESVNGLSSVTLIFEPGTDLLTARQVVQERLTRAPILAHLTDPPMMLQPQSSASRVLVVGLRSEEVSPIEMSVLARWSLRPKLLGVPGVANVSIFGQRERQLQVQVEPAAMAEHGVGLQEIINTSGNALWVSPLSYLNASSPGTGGFVDSPSARLEVRHVSPITTPDDLAQVAVERASGTRSDLVLGDVANVVEQHQPLIGDAIVGDGPGLTLVIEKLPGASTVEVTKGVEAALDTLAPGLEGISVENDLFRPATFVQQARDNYLLALGIGVLLAWLLVTVALFSWRAAAIALVSGATSILAAALVMVLAGAHLNAMVLAGLALAVVVIIHDSVIDVDSLGRRRRGSRSDDSSARGSGPRAFLETRGMAGYATAIVLAALLPLLVLSRLSSSFYRPAVAAFGLAILASLLVALTVTPVLASLLLRAQTPSTGRSGAGRALRESVELLVRRGAGSGRAMAAALALVGIAGVAALPFTDLSRRPAQLPDFREYDLVVHWQGEPGVSRTGMTDDASELSSRLRAIDGVSQVGGHVGRAVLSDRVNGIGAGELWVRIDPGARYSDTVAKVIEATGDYDGAEAEVGYYYSDRIEAVSALMSEVDRGPVASADDEVVVRIYGEAFAVVNQQAGVAAARLEALESVTDVRVDAPLTEPNLEVEVDLDAARRHGLKPGDVRRAAATMVSGLKVGSLFEDQKVFDVVVVGDPEFATNPDALGSLPIDKADGETVRLDDVARVGPGTSFSTINRESVSRRLDLVATVSGDPATAVGEIEASLASMEFPLEYHAEVIAGGARSSGSALPIVVGVASIAAILLLLQAGLGSWRLAVITLALIPLGMVGGVVGTALDGGTVTVGTVLGFATVLAMVVRSALLQVRHYHRMEFDDGVEFGPALVARGTSDLTTQTVLAVAAGAVAMLPILVAGSRPGLEIVHPMAVVVVGGAFTTVLLSLFVLPRLYLEFAGGARPEWLDEAIGPPTGAPAGEPSR